MKIALTIAGSDSGGGAGIQADIKAMHANGVFAASVITAITAQNTVAVTAAFEVPVELIEAQIDAVFDDVHVDATKTGMLSSSEIIEAVARKLEEREIRPLVVDPVMISKSGFRLLRDDAVETLKGRLIPLATLITPNAHEAGHLTGMEVRSAEAAREAAHELFRLGPGAVLVKGGHFEDEQFEGEQFEGGHFEGKHFEGEHFAGKHFEDGEHLADEQFEGEHVEGKRFEGEHLADEHFEGEHVEGRQAAVDVLYDGRQFFTFTAPLIRTRNTHGTGCTYASSIAANLARGFTLHESIARSKRYVTEAIRNGLSIGEGHGPTHHFYFLEGSSVFPIGSE